MMARADYEQHALASAAEALRRVRRARRARDALLAVPGVGALARGSGVPRFHPKLLRNRDQWQQLATFVTQHTVTFHWIKGHDGIELNERCDKLAGEARREMLKLTYGGTLSVRPKLATQPTITPEPGQVIDVVWGGGFRMTPAIYLREGEVATFIDGKKKVWKLPDGAIFRRRPFAIQPDLLRFADKELRSADA